MGEVRPIPDGPDTMFLGGGCSLVEPQLKVCHMRGKPNASWAETKLVQEIVGLLTQLLSLK